MLDNIIQAEKEFEKAFQIDSSDVMLVYQLADTKSRRLYGNNKETERLYEKALKMLEPDPVMMHNIYGSRAMSFHRAEDFRTAIRYYELSYRYNPKNISALSSIGYCYERMKEYDKALKYYEEYIKAGKPGSKGYKFVEESIAYIKQEKFMEETE
jgi:tetratricopeptide (TPR) repeat protein